jgi:hypothetical protein
MKFKIAATALVLSATAFLGACQQEGAAPGGAAPDAAKPAAPDAAKDKPADAAKPAEGADAAKDKPADAAKPAEKPQ